MRLEKKRNYYEGNGERGMGNGVARKVQKPLSDQRMKDGLKVASGGGRAGARPSREDNFGQLGAVYSAIWSENRLAKARDNGRNGSAPRRFQLVNDIVRI